jgi:hypothetical protein
MLEMGILDPAKVTRLALQNAASVAGLLLTTEVMIAEAPKDESSTRLRAAWANRHPDPALQGASLDSLAGAAWATWACKMSTSSRRSTIPPGICGAMSVCAGWRGSASVSP